MRLGSRIQIDKINPEEITDKVLEVINPTLDKLERDIGFEKEEVPALVVADNWIMPIIIDNINLGGGKREIISTGVLGYTESHDFRQAFEETYLDFKRFGLSELVDGRSVFVFPWSSRVEKNLRFFYRVPNYSTLPYFGKANILGKSKPLFIFQNQNPANIEYLEEPVNLSMIDELRLTSPFRKRLSLEEVMFKPNTKRVVLTHSMSEGRLLNLGRSVFGERDFYGSPTEFLHLTWLIYGMQDAEERPVFLKTERIFETDFPLGKLPKGGLKKYVEELPSIISEEYATPVSVYSSTQ